MRKIFGIFSLTFFLSVLVFAGTKEEIEKLQNDLLLLQKKIESLSVELLNLNKKIEDLENKIETLKRSSQTADLRVDLENLKLQVEKLNINLTEIQGIQSYTQNVTTNIETPPKQPMVSFEQAPEFIYQNAYSDYIQGRYELAISGFKKFLEFYPNHPLAENSSYWIGECYYGLKDYSKAKDVLSEVIANYPRGSKYYSAKLKLALTNYSMGEKSLAKKMLVEIIKDNPGSTEAGIAKEKLRVLFQD